MTDERARATDDGSAVASLQRGGELVRHRFDLDSSSDLITRHERGKRFPPRVGPCFDRPRQQGGAATQQDDREERQQNRHHDGSRATGRRLPRGPDATSHQLACPVRPHPSGSMSLRNTPSRPSGPSPSACSSGCARRPAVRGSEQRATRLAVCRPAEARRSDVTTLRGYRAKERRSDQSRTTDGARISVLLRDRARPR